MADYDGPFTLEQMARDDPDKVGDCWQCGGFVAVGSEHDDYVFIGSRVYHRGCAERLRDDLEAVL